MPLKGACSYLVLLRMGFTLPVLLPKPAVRSYHTVSPLPLREWRFVFCGTSLGLPSLDVIQHSDPVEPDSRCLLQQPAAIQLSDLSQFIATQISRRQHRR